MGRRGGRTPLPPELRKQPYGSVNLTREQRERVARAAQLLYDGNASLFVRVAVLKLADEVLEGEEESPARR